MAETTTRLRLHRPTGGDPATVPGDLERLTDQLDAAMLGYSQGPLSSRPQAGVEGRLYYAIDHASLYYDNGAGWVVNGYQPGDLRFSAAQTPGPGWLVCDGGSHSRAAYAALFSAIGTNFGSADGATFKVPNFQNRFPLGVSATRTIGRADGLESVSLTAAHNGPHAHGPAGGLANLLGAHPSPQDFAAPAAPGQLGAIPIHGSTTTSSSGSGTPHDNMPPWLAVNVWIKT